MDERTKSGAYAARLRRREDARWKRLLNVQAPYRWNLRRLQLGFTLDVGCGLGRNLYALEGVGVDHNAEAVAVACRRGFVAFTPDDFQESEYATPGRFDSLLLAHVVEHMRHGQASDLIADYLPFVRSGGRVVLIAPQESGYRSDPTHVEFMDESALRSLLGANGVAVEREYSFPFVRPIGRFLRYNEFVTVGRRP